MTPESSQMAANKNVEQIAKLESEQVEARTLSERIAGAVTRAAGTATFAIGHFVWFAGWILVNGGIVRRLRQIAEKLRVSVVDSDQALAAETNLDELVATMDESLPGSPGNASPLP